jgi:hypothetical protein
LELAAQVDFLYLYQKQAPDLEEGTKGSKEYTLDIIGNNFEKPFEAEKR